MMTSHSIDISKFHRVFYATQGVYYANGDEGIRALRDKYSKQELVDDPEPILAIVLKSDIYALGAAKARNGADAPGAEDTLNFIEDRQRSFRQPDGTVEVGDNLFLYLANDATLDDLCANLSPSVPAGQTPALKQKLEIICQDTHDVIVKRMEGFNAGISRFDKVNPNIRKEGIKLLHNDDLYDYLQSEINGPFHGKQARFELDIFPEKLVTKFFPNQYIVVGSQRDPEAPPVIGWVIGDVDPAARTGERFTMGELQYRIIPDQELRSYHPLGAKPLNNDVHQTCYLHALRQPHISTLFVTGGAASGKTYLGYASALAQTLRQIKHGAGGGKEKDFISRFERIGLTKSNDLIGGSDRERGFLPGTEQEKMWADVMSYVDAHDELHLRVKGGKDHEKEQDPRGRPQEGRGHGKGHDGKGQDAKDEGVPLRFQNLMGPVERGTRFSPLIGYPLFVPNEYGVIAVEDYAHWRGRTFNKTCLFFDEAQNLRPVEMKHLLQRVGKDSVTIVSGDYDHQMDNPKLNATSNGLFYGIKHFLGEPYTAVIHLEGSYRSWAAEHAGRMKVFR